MRALSPLTICRSAGLALAACLLAGCEKQEIRVYNVPKETEQVRVATTQQTGPSGGIHWVAPSDWVEQPASGMRAGSFSISKGDQTAEVSIIPLPGSSENDLDNVNRWRGQIGLAPVGSEQLPGLTEKIQIGNREGKLFNMVGSDPKTKKPTRMLAAILNDQGTSWFFKMNGADELVAGQKEAFSAFLKSISLNSSEASPELSQASGSDRNADSGAAAPKSSHPVPEGWEELPATSMVLARFGRAEPGLGRAEVTVTVFPGDVGGLLANVNRWRNQLGLVPVTETDLTKVTNAVDVNGEKATQIEMTSDKPSSSGSTGTRLVVLMVSREGRTWFYKMMGDDKLVSKEKPALTKFVQSIH